MLYQIIMLPFVMSKASTIILGLYVFQLVSILFSFSSGYGRLSGHLFVVSFHFWTICIIYIHILSNIIGKTSGAPFGNHTVKLDGRRGSHTQKRKKKIYKEVFFSNMAAVEKPCNRHPTSSGQCWNHKVLVALDGFSGFQLPQVVQFMYLGKNFT